MQFTKYATYTRKYLIFGFGEFGMPIPAKLGLADTQSLGWLHSRNKKNRVS